MIDLKLVESFILVMRSGSLTRAEDMSGVPKATLSRQIAKLEEILGVQLFLRSPRRITPTESGKTFYAHCERMVAEANASLETAQTAVQNLSEGVRGDLYVVTNNQFSTSFVCHVIRLFLERYPNVTCHLDLTSDDVFSIADDVDCYVCTQLPDHPNLVGKLLGKLTYRLFASPSYLLQHGTPATPGELARHKGIVLSQSDQDQTWHLQSQEGSYDYRPPAIVTTNDYWVMKTFAIDGVGIAMLPDFFTRPEFDAGALRTILPDWHPAPIPVYCLYQKQRYMGKKLRALIDLMIECFQHIDSYQCYVGHPAKNASR